ncbi:MAG TPA: hypothetical protein DCR93_38965 [Cytophagales bacterium]|nr:hypothetical protein [Cytophagales bacterium]
MREQAFWAWFEQHYAPLLFLREVDRPERERIMDECLNRLHEFHPQLFFQIGGHPEADRYELIITAEGVKEAFPIVEQLVAAPPVMKDWHVVAFKQPQGTHLSLEYGGRRFTPQEIDIIPMEHHSDPSMVGFQVCYPEYSPLEKNLYFGGTYLLLETILGEKSAALDIDFLEIIRTPGHVHNGSSFKMAQIDNYIRTKKSKSLIDESLAIASQLLA